MVMIQKIKGVHIHRPLNVFDAGLQIGLIDLIQRIYDLYGEALTVAEIGCYGGESTVEFAKAFDCVLAIDPWVNGYDENDGASHISKMIEVYQNFCFITRNFRNINVYRNTSETASEMIADVDGVYIDGIHTYEGVKRDLEVWSPKCKKFISGHDFGFRGVRRAVDEFRAEWKPHSIEVFRDQSWLLVPRDGEDA